MFVLPELIHNQMKSYRSAVETYSDGNITPERFKGVRVPWGIYSERRSDTYMMRIRLPGGVVSPTQLRALSTASERFSNASLHITTRQDIQLHHVLLPDTVKALDYLHDYNLSSYGGGGNTVRNVLGCPLSGVCKDEVFDIRPHVNALSERLLNEEKSVTMPRKLKISVSGCAKDCSGCLVNDVGLLAAVRDGRRGFSVYAAGGMGAKSKIGHMIDDFVEEKQIGRSVAAVRNVFFVRGDRKNKHRNRLRFLVENIGVDTFRELYASELAALQNEDDLSLREITEPWEEIGHEKRPGSIESEDSDFLRFSVTPQRQENLSAVEVRVPAGNLEASQASALADLQEHFPQISFRTSQNQNLFITGVRNRDLPDIHAALRDIFDEFTFPGTLFDVVSCKGVTTCNLGLCDSMALARVLEKRLRSELADSSIIGKSSIKISGCPNACGHHPIAPIGLHGLVRKIDGRPAPFYKLLLGGRKGAERSRLATEAGILPAKSVPDFLIDFIRDAEKIPDAGPPEEISAGWLPLAREKLKQFRDMPKHSDSPDYYRDWGKSVDFSLDGLGQGECGAGVIDMIESDLREAGIALENAESGDLPSKLLLKALYLSSRALLVVRGSDPTTEDEALEQFRKLFVDTGIADGSYKQNQELYTSIQTEPSGKSSENDFRRVRDFHAHIHDLYNAMDSSFNFPRIPKGTMRKRG